MNTRTPKIGSSDGEGKFSHDGGQNDNGAIRVHISDLVVYNKPLTHLLGCRMKLGKLISYLGVRK